MSQTYIIIDDDKGSILKTQAVAERFKNLSFVASANNYDDGLNLILEHQPRLVFLEIDPTDKKCNLSLALINELYRYLRIVPKIIVITNKNDLAYEALQYEVIDYLLKPVNINDFRKAILKFDRAIKSNVPYSEEKNPVATFEVLDEALVEDIEIAENPEVTLGTPIVSGEMQKPKSLVICVKSYGDYRYINANDICYLQADNNSTDIHLASGEMITAFKTLKHFEGVLKYPFIRIHNSYIVNIDFVSRIHTGNAVCHIKDTTTKLPFSKSYKENIDAVINTIASGNYLEI